MLVMSLQILVHLAGGANHILAYVLIISVDSVCGVVHTMEELKLTGNHLKGSRPLLTFSSNFDKDVHWKLLKEMLTQVSFGCLCL